MKKQTCPICRGAGQILSGFHYENDSEARKVMARSLIAAGYSYRETAKLIGWKSPGAVQKAVKYKPQTRKPQQKRS